MKILNCISVTAPMAYLMAYGVKKTENRTWLPGELPRRLYLHTTKDSGGLWIVDEDFPGDAFFRFKKWRDEGGPEENWMPFFMEMVRIERAHYKCDKFADLDIQKTFDDFKNWFMKPAAIIGWVDVVSCDKEQKDVFDDEGFFHWRIGNYGILKEPITNVLGKQRIWRYQYG